MAVITKNKNVFEIIETKMAGDAAYILKFERRGLIFNPGSYVCIGSEYSQTGREYSIYSGINDPFIEVLIKEVTGGKVSNELKKLKAGDKIWLQGPFGEFHVPTNSKSDQQLLFLATGTGISPFHSIIKSKPQLNYRLLHGVRYASEAFNIGFYEKEKYTLCTSADNAGHYKGRITTLLHTMDINSTTLCYLCGNSNMIFDAYTLLTQKGIAKNQLFTEVYF
jgi:ferredoxin--NADP+ reductase/benzoate/toluate 1,2-dioxygenase reductase subunit